MSAPYINGPINNFVENWSEFMTPEATEEFRQYGYCSLPFKLADGSELKGSKVIVIQTNASNSENWYMPAYKNDPAKHIEWLEATLAQIEKDNGIAYIIGHQKPEDFTYEFGIRYAILMERYQHIIRATLMGHTHDQYYHITSSVTNPSKTIGVT